MPEYWKKIHDEALAGMRMLIAVMKSDKVEDNCHDMECALAYVMHHGSCMAKAKAVGYFSDYKWATHEIAAHAAEKPAAK